MYLSYSPRAMMSGPGRGIDVLDVNRYHGGDSGTGRRGGIPNAARYR